MCSQIHLIRLYEGFIGEDGQITEVEGSSIPTAGMSSKEIEEQQKHRIGRGSGKHRNYSNCSTAGSVEVVSGLVLIQRKHFSGVWGWSRRETRRHSHF